MDTLTQANPLRVLFVSHAYVVGVNQGKLHAVAANDNVIVGLLAPSNWMSLEWNRDLPVESPYSSVQIYSAPVLFSGRVGAYMFSPWAIWQVLQDFKPDIIQVEVEVFSLCAFEFAIWSALTKKPLAVFGWENLNRQLPLPRRLTCQFVLDHMSLMVAGNQDGADIVRGWGYKGLLEVMPQMGVDPDFFSTRHRQADFQQSLSTGDRSLKIGYLGRLAHSKGVDLVLTALQHLRSQGLNCRVILCGSGSMEAELKQQADRLEISDWLTWRGAVRHEAVPVEIGQFDVLVLPSRTTPTWKEQFGHVLIEAMAMGVPVIGSDSGEIPNVIGRTDLIFHEDDANGLTTLLARMVQDVNWRLEVAQYGTRRVNQLYTHKRIAERLLNLWESVFISHRKSYLS